MNCVNDSVDTFDDVLASEKSQSNPRSSYVLTDNLCELMAREQAYMCYEIEVAMATYVAPCVQDFPSIRYYYSEWCIGYVKDEDKYEINSRWYSVTKLARIGDHRRSHHTIILDIDDLNILSIWHV
ncbi:Chromodomain-helicase-DNA-binding 1 [Gossypium arboreum]|uniref:Chromodomain-helicase-DNA-binding 1 n=1 Tax=Gossypium arboreum TaxID=29729 RepID=A0A0B0P626_GOSAR|nr:Chromodomain-helicase-DNA-binding 1 [Gossypium arboreum]